jgi:hypothetical protein
MPDTGRAIPMKRIVWREIGGDSFFEAVLLVALQALQLLD